MNLMVDTPRIAVLYDGGCGFCTTTVSWLRRLDWRVRLCPIDIHAAWEQLEVRYPGVRRDACLEAMHVVQADGRITAGFDGFRTLAWAVPLLAPIAPLLYVPGVPQLGRVVYRWVAAHRSTTCRVDARDRPRTGPVSASRRTSTTSRPRH